MRVYNKFFKFALLTIATLSLFLSLTGCTKISESFDENVVEPTESETSLETGLLERAELCMSEFITAVNLQKYDSISSYINMPENSFISDENIKWYITRTALADITGVSMDTPNIKVSDGAVEKNVIVTINKQAYSFDMELDTNNEWKIILPELYVNNWSLKIPKGCTIEVNNENVDKHKVPATVIDEYDTYTFPAISKQKITVVTTSTIYGDFISEITPVSDSETIPVICKLNDAETTSILRQIQNIWNGLYTDYKNGVEVEAVKKYFTDDFDNNVITDIMQTWFPALEVGSQKETFYSNFYMKETIPWTKDNYGAAILSSNDSVLVNFGYRIDFVSNHGGSYNANKASQITMKYFPEESTYKIKTVNSNKLFYDNDYSLNDY